MLCLLGLVAVIGFLGSHRGGGGERAATGGDGGADDGGGGLVHKVEVTDADVMGWTEENLTALARRPPVRTMLYARLLAPPLQRSSSHVN